MERRLALYGGKGFHQPGLIDDDLVDLQRARLPVAHEAAEVLQLHKIMVVLEEKVDAGGGDL